MGKTFCYIFFVLNLYTAVFIIQSMVEAISVYSSCFDEFCSIGVCRNVCAHFAILWLNYLADFGSSVAVLFLRRKRTLDCLNATHSLLINSTPKRKFRAPAWIVIFFMVIHCSTFFLHWNHSNFRVQFLTDYLPLYMTQCIPIVSENMISVLLLIAEDSFIFVNKQLEELADRKVFLFAEQEHVTASLNRIKFLYSETADVSSNIADSFGIDFLITGFCTTMRFIYFLFITLQYMAKEKVVQKDGGFVLPSYDSIVFFVAVLGKLFYLCYRCDGVVSQVCLTLMFKLVVFRSLGAPLCKSDLDSKSCKILLIKTCNYYYDKGVQCISAQSIFFKQKNIYLQVST